MKSSPVAFRTHCAGAVAALSAVAIAAALPAAAAEPGGTTPLPPTTVNLSSSATLEVVKDLLTITFNTTRDGSDAATVQSQLKQALDAALAEAKKAARPGQLEVQTGNFMLVPRYTAKGVAGGWQGSVELIVEGRDMAAIGQLAGRITTLTIGRVGYSLSREVRERSEGEVAAQAIGRFRAKAADYAKQFGYAGYALGGINVSSADPGPGPRPMMMSRNAISASTGDESLSVEPGKGTVTVTVSGSVQMTRQ